MRSGLRHTKSADTDLERFEVPVRRGGTVSQVATVLLVGLAIHCCCRCIPGCGATMQRQQQRQPLNRTFKCLPVAHDALWKRLRFVSGDLHQFLIESNFEHSTTTTTTTTATATTTKYTTAPPTPTTDDDLNEPYYTTEPPEISLNNPTEDWNLTEVMLYGNSSTGYVTVDHDLAQGHDLNQSVVQGHDLTQNVVQGHDLDLGETRVRKRRTSRRRRGHKRSRRRQVVGIAIRRNAWHCRMKKYWKRMPPGVFPAYVQTARCRQRVCMFGLFECRPRRYGIKVLRRNDGVCNPLPNLGPSADYEETWSFVEYKVVVGCECSRKLAVNGDDKTPLDHPRVNQNS